MQSDPIRTEQLSRSVIAVPPLARRTDLAIDREQNRRIIRHLEMAGVKSLLYGGNANLYHMGPAEYDALLELLAEETDARTLVIPAAGPAWGTMMEQARLLRSCGVPTVMVLPHQGITTERGVETGIRRFVEAIDRPAVLYIKHDGYIDVAGARRLVDDGLIAWIKYAVVRQDPARDPFLEQLVEAVDPRLVVSGMGEQPVPAHVRGFGLAGFTSGCVCIAPRLSNRMLEAVRAGDWAEAERIRALFSPLEQLRDAISPIRVLHEAVRLAGIADTGPLTPLLSNLEPTHHPLVAEAADALLEQDRRAVA